jgi:uncharacterized protein involved in exopolysaccharide biosynthesis
MNIAITIWSGRKTILKVIIIFLVIGLLYAFGSKKEYKASCKLMPEVQENLRPNLGGLGNLAGLAGLNIDLGNTSSALLPDHYPLITRSLPFQQKILNEKIEIQKLDTVVSLYNYLYELDKSSVFEILYDYTVGLPFKIRSLIMSHDINLNEKYHSKGRNIISLSYEENKIIEEIRDRIKADTEPLSGIISITVEMPDPLAAAEVADNSIRLLTEYVTQYKISKAKENLKFIQERYDEVKINFEETQRKLAIFNDRNRNVSTALAQTELQKLQNEYDLAFDLYKNFATNLEQAKIKVKEETPVFTILEPVQVPIKKSKPKRILIITISFFLGAFFGVLYLFLKIVFTHWKSRWNMKQI